jgi:hypothetical protein
MQTPAPRALALRTTGVTYPGSAEHISAVRADLRPILRDCPIQQLQALDDAIAWRRARITAPCPDCEPGPDGCRCDDHACDLDLIAAYRQMANATIKDLST